MFKTRRQFLSNLETIASLIRFIKGTYMVSALSQSKNTAKEKVRLAVIGEGSLATTFSLTV